MSTSRNHPLTRLVSRLRSNIDATSGPRTPNDPRSVRQVQQMMASRMAGYGLKYDDEGRLAVDTEELELLALATDNVEDSLEQGIAALAARGYLGRMIDWDFVQATTANTASEFTYASLTVPKDLLIGKHAVRMVTWGDFKQNSGADAGMKLNIELGGTAIFTDQTSSTLIPNHAGRRGILIDFTIQAINSSAAQQLYGKLSLGNNDGASPGIANFLNATDVGFWHYFNLGSTVDCSVSNALAIKLTMVGSGVPSANYEYVHYGSHLFAY